MPYAKRLAEVRQRESPSIIKLSFRWVACTNFCTVDVDDLSQILALLSRFRFFTSAYYLGKCFSGRSSKPAALMSPAVVGSSYVTCTGKSQMALVIKKIHLSKQER